MIRKLAVCLTALLMGWAGQQAHAQVRISEWMYNGLGSGGAGEYFEITNFGLVAVSLNSWSFDDDSRTANTVDLSSLGSLGPGESAIITELTEADFRTNWNLPASVLVLGSNTTNFGRNDEINLYDDLDNLVDRLTYGDQNIPGTIRTQGRSGSPISGAALGANDVSQWELSNALGDSHGSYFSLVGEQGNPGYVVPEPGSMVLGAISLLVTLGCHRRS